ncbi:unnamed protein product [Caenorhabditis brenneri]
MSLSRPATFPLLKLPWLCIKCVIQNSDEFILVLFATISNRTRRIVLHSKHPLKEIDVYPSGCSKISIKDQLGKRANDQTWYFLHNKNVDNDHFLLKINSQPLLTSASFPTNMGSSYLHSYTTGGKLDALKLVMEFMIDVFGCTVRQVIVDGNKLSELFRLGISTVKELYIGNSEPVNITDLKFLLENIKVTDEYVFNAPIPANFSCDPQIFKCRKLYFGRRNSADWVTLELLCQFDVPQLDFWHHRFSVEDIVSYITFWFNSENRTQEYAQFKFIKPVSLHHFNIDHLNPMPFCEKRRSRRSLHKSLEKTDLSSGMDILRKDGLLATLYAFPTSFLFHVWHKRFPNDVQQ